uniref:ATP-dependent DNA helicase n=1 Tax=Globodera pallida TaxID=36090 RepID=A0A183CLH7_GLOPA
MELLLSMIRRCGNKAGHLSLLRNLVRELLEFKLEEKKEAAFQRGQGIGLNANLAGWDVFDAWAGYEPTNDSELQKKVKQHKKPRMDVIPKASERISPRKPPASWMTVIKGKAVPQSSQAAPKPVTYPLGYEPVKQTKMLRGGGLSRDRAKREADKARMRQRRSADGADSTPTPSQSPKGKRVGRRTAHSRIAGAAKEEDNILMPPPSSRPTRQRKAPQRYSSSSLERWPDVPISCICKNNTHTGFCASLSANHTPRYYNTLVPFGYKQLYRCPHCAALLLKSEATGQAAFSKCCAKGKVKMEQQFYELQRPFLRPAQRLQADEEAHTQLDNTSKQLDTLLNDLILGRHPLANKFMKLVDRFNHELAFGTATTEQKPVPGGYQPVKMNGMVTYRLSGLNPPRNADGSTREELCGQVWTLNPDNAIELRKRRNLDARLHLDNELLDLLHRLMSHQQLGHPLSGLYFHLKRIYEEAKQQQADAQGPPVDKLRIRLLTRGEVMQQHLPEAHNIHPHQLQLPESVDQLAQLFFVDGDDGLPPAAEQGVMLKTRSGALTVLPWWDNWIDGAICPLLFPRGGSVWKPSLPLTNPDLAAPQPQQPSGQEDEEQRVMPIINEEDADWKYNPPVDVLALNVAERYIENIYGKTPPGMPEHSLQLKIGAVMMVIKNISVAHGLCNGTRVQIIALGNNIITCRYIQGPRAGTDFKLYRHRFRFGGSGREATRHGAVKWTRLQFPLRPGFCFAHGQFYVAMSRVRSSDDIRVLASARSSNCVQNWVVQAVVDKEDIEEARQYAGPTAALQPPQPGPSVLPGLRPSPFEPTNSEHSDGSNDDNDDDQRPQRHRGGCQL